MKITDKINDWINDKTITKKDNLSIIDIGFKEPGGFFELYHTIDLNNYLGIDLIKERECSVHYKDACVTFDMSRNIYNEYIEYSKLRSFEPIDITSFKNIFTFQWETNILDYIKLNPTELTKFNLGIFSNILHKIEDKKIAENILMWYAQNSTEKAYAYLSVMDNDFEWKNAKEDYTYSVEEFNHLIGWWKCLTYEKVDGFHTALIKKKD